MSLRGAKETISPLEIFKKLAFHPLSFPPPPFCSHGKGPQIPPTYAAPLSFHRLTLLAPEKTPSSPVGVSHPVREHSASPAKSKFISFHALRCYWLHIVLMQLIITETALKICIFYLCFIIPRIFCNPFSSTWASLKYILASFMSSWNWIANSYCNENTHAPAQWYTALHSNYSCALINLNWRVLSLNCW